MARLKRKTRRQHVLKHRKPVHTFKRTKASFARYIPAAVLTITAFFITVSSGQFGSSVLAYATNISPTGLLTSTNQERAEEGVTTLTLNSALASAAQAKAEDMVSRDYWSHVTPDGEQPWVFITAAGYSYDSAGENLAYGFTTSSETVIGWMNSPSHKENLLNSAYREVGFGIANSPDFINSGQQTVVVAMYGKPYVKAATAPVSSKPKPAPPVSSPVKSEAKNEEAEVIAQLEVVKEEPEATPDESVATANAEQTFGQPLASPAQIPRIQILTHGEALWSVSVVIAGVLAVCALWLVHKGVHLHRNLRAAEIFVFHHLHIDLTVLAVIYLGWTLLSASGTVR